MDKQPVKLTFFNIEELEYSLDKIKDLCIDKTIREYPIEQIGDIILAFNLLKQSFKSLGNLQDIILSEGVSSHETTGQARHL